MNSLDPMLDKQGYEDRVRWLQSLYGDRTESKQPSQLARMANHLLFVLGRNLVSLGERMQSSHDMPTSSLTTK